MRPLFLFLSFFAAAAQAQPLPSIEAKSAGLEKLDGYFPMYWDADEGKIWLEIPRFDEEFLYVVSRPSGLGSNDVGLDRTQRGAGAAAERAGQL